MHTKIVAITTLLNLACFSDPPTMSGETGDETGEDSSTSASTTSAVTSASQSSSSPSSSDPVSTTGTSETTSDEDSSSDSSAESSSGEPADLGALGFDGDDEAVSTPTSSATLPSLFTVEVWIDVQEDVDFYGIIIDTRTEDLSEGWVFYVDPPWSINPHRMIVGWGAGPIVGGSVVGLDPGWHHLAFSRDPQGRVRSFIDGALQTEEQQLTSPTPRTSAISVGRLLLLDSDTDYWWRGAPIDDLHVSATTRYTENFVPGGALKDIDSTLLWRFNEGEGDTAVDDVSGIILELDGPIWTEGR